MRPKTPASLSLVATGAALGVLLAAGLGSAASRPSKSYTIEQFMATVSIAGSSFSPDETRVLLSSNQTGIFNVYTVPAAGGIPTAPNDERVLFTRDRGGNELNHLYVREIDGKERDLTPGEKLKASFERWTPSGDAFYVTTNERDPKFFDVYKEIGDPVAQKD